MKKSMRAIAPDNPRISNIILLLPHGFILLILRKVKLMTSDTSERKNTISTAGMWLRYFTPTFINAKKNVAKSMYLTPFVIIKSI